MNEIDWATIAGAAALFTGLNAASAFIGKWAASRTRVGRESAQVEHMAEAVDSIQESEAECSRFVTASLTTLREDIARLVTKDELRGNQIDRLIDALADTNKQVNQLVGAINNRRQFEQGRPQ